MRRGIYHGPRRIGLGSIQRYSNLREWDEYDPRMTEYYDPDNGYTSGPGLHLPTDHMPYTIRATGIPFKLYVRGIHPHTTEEGIHHIFSNYGEPVNVIRTRNSQNQPIAFVEFLSQVEADLAVYELDGKPPLNWEVSYARRVEDRLRQQFSHLEMEPQLDMAPFVPNVGRQVPFSRTPAGFVNTDTQIEVSRPSSGARVVSLAEFPPCGVCGRNAQLVCTVCKTRYCSSDCQKNDWPIHRQICKPLPPLEVANHQVSRQPPITQAPANGHAARGIQSTEIAVTIQGTSLAAQPSRSSEAFKHGQQNEKSPRSSTVKGIHPLDQQQPAGSIRSPNWKSNDTPVHQNRNLNGVSPINKNFNSSGPTMPSNSAVPNRQNENNYGAKPRNFQLGNGSPCTPVASPPKKSPQKQTSVALVYAKEFSKRKLTPLSDKPLQVCVSHLKSPHDFYVQYAPFEERLQKLTLSVQASAVKSEPVVNPIEGMPCLAIYAFDRNWYRAQVMKVMPDGVGVRFVDYGNRQKSINNAENFRLMEQNLSEDPFYAVNVKLADVDPVGSNTWSSEVIIKFRELVENVNFNLEHVGTEGEVLVIRLKDANGNDLARRLIQENLAAKPRIDLTDELDRIPPSNAMCVPPPPEVMHRQKPRLSSLQEKRLPHATVPTTTLAGSQDSSKGNSNLPPQLPAPTSSPTRAAVRQTPTVLPRLPSTSVASVIRASTPVAAPTSMEKLSKSIIALLDHDVEFGILVNEVLKSGGVVATLFRDQKDLIVFEFNEKVASTLETTPDFKPSVGSVVAALSREHEQWFRAHICQVLDSSYSVIYVDFGNTEEVVSVKPIPLSYQPEELAVKLTLVGEASEEAKKLVEKEMFPNSHHSLKFISKDNDGTVVVTLLDGLTFRLESWTSLMAQPQAAPVPPRDIPSLQWEPGFSSDVLVTVADDVDCIYVQTFDQESVNLFDKIQKELRDYFPTSLKMANSPPVGSCVAALFPEDKEVYRARVKEINGEMITLFYVDYGNTTTVSLADVRPLPDNLYQFPAVCKRVALAEITRPAGPISTAVKELLLAWISNVSNVLITSSTADLNEGVLTKDGDVLNVLVRDLLDLQQPQEMPILEMAPEPVLPQKEKIPGDDTLGEFTYENCAFEKMPDGDFQAVILASADGPQCIMLRIADENLSVKLSQLQEEMADYAETVSRGHAANVNEICIARFPDGQWYRAACLGVVPGAAGNRYSFIQVDNGHIREIDVEFVRRIPKRFVEFLPFQSFHCILEGTGSIDGVKNDLVSRFAEILPENSVKTVRVVGDENNGCALIVRIPEVSAILSEESLL